MRRFLKDYARYPTVVRLTMSNCSCSVSWHPIFVTNVTGCSRRYHCRLTSSAAGCAARRCGAWRCGVCAIERARSLSRKSLGKRKRLFRGPPSDNASSARSTPISLNWRLTWRRSPRSKRQSRFCRYSEFHQNPKYVSKVLLFCFKRFGRTCFFFMSKVRQPLRNAFLPHKRGIF